MRSATMPSCGRSMRCFAAVAAEREACERSFGVAPAFRIGIHGGDVIVSEQGDAKRSIGIYGDAINIAARMEEAARAYDVRCVISETVAGVLSDPRLRPCDRLGAGQGHLRSDRDLRICAEVTISFGNRPHRERDRALHRKPRAWRELSR